LAETIGKIRELLGELEREWEVKAVSKADLSFSALELPQIIQEIVDDLQPLLTPYDSVFYWFMFRHSICKSGEPYLRVSTRNLQGAVVKSARSDKADRLVSESKVQEILRDLELAGAIRKEGEPSRDGTPYRLFIPDEIEACRAFRAARLPKET
jgi:hypothetical protein